MEAGIVLEQLALYVPRFFFRVESRECGRVFLTWIRGSELECGLVSRVFSVRVQSSESE